jgi:hypothetical protein
MEHRPPEGDRANAALVQPEAWSCYNVSWVVVPVTPSGSLVLPLFHFCCTPHLLVLEANTARHGAEPRGRSR